MTGSGGETPRDLTLILPAGGSPPCTCGAARVCVFRDGIDSLMDNMGCELGLELLAGPLCPSCDREKILAARQTARRSRPGKEERPG